MNSRLELFQEVNIKSKTISGVIGVLVLLAGAGFLLENTFKAQQFYSDAEWNKKFQDSYGSILPNFYPLGENGFQARWLTEKEDEVAKCQVNKHCVFIKLATISSCEKGAVVSFSVHNSKEQVISEEATPVFVIKDGEYVVVELGSPRLTTQGFIQPLDAYCSEDLPSV